MQTNLTLRKGMMNLMKDSFDDLDPLSTPPDLDIVPNPVPDDYGTILFKNSDGDILCRVPFSSFVSIVLGDDAVYEFRSVSDDPVLQAGMVDSIPVNNTVTNFAILGLLGGVATNIVTGSVGSSSNNDIRFTITSWDQETFITITDLRISLRQGS